MRILVTRPQEDAERLAGQLEEKGHQVFVEPLFTIEPDLEAPIDLDGVQALLLTSANGARAFALRSPRRDLRVFAVGDATADAARSFGFGDVESAGGDVVALARLVRERARPEDGPLLHAGGSVVAGDLAGDLAASGFEVRRAALYRAEPVAALSEPVTAALRDGRIDIVLFFSPRTARVFVSLARVAGLEEACRSAVALGLSPAVAEAVAEIPWAARIAADAPTEAAVIDAVGRLAGGSSGASHDDGASDRMNEQTTPDQTPEPVPTVTARATPGAEPPHGRRHSMIPAALAIVLALAAIGWIAWNEFMPPPDRAGERIARIEQRVTVLEREAQDRVVTTGQGRGEAERRDAALAARIGGVETRLGALTETLSGIGTRVEQMAQEPRNDAEPARLAALTAENSRLGHELARLQEEVAALNATLGARAESRRGDSLVLAFGQLREAVIRGAPYGPALATARAVAVDDQNVLPLLASLEPNAESGIATRADLRARFDKVAADVMRRETTANADGWWRPLAERLSSLISVRRVGEVEGDGTAAVVARAEQRLAADDLAGAVAELEKLQGEAAAAAQDWLAAARARLAADAALARLSAHVLQQGPSAP